MVRNAYHKQCQGESHAVDAPAGDARTWRRADRLGRSREPRRRPPIPAGTIKMIVPYPAGGTTDLLGRLVAEQIKSGLDAVVVVENKPGAGTTLGAEQVARVRARRLHAADRDLDHAGHQQDALQEAALRSGQGFYADRAGRRVPFCADHQPEHSGQDAGRIHRLCQVEPGPGLWLGRQRQPAASRRRDAEDRRPASTSVTCRIAAACRRCSM